MVETGHYSSRSLRDCSRNVYSAAIQKAAKHRDWHRDSQRACPLLSRSQKLPITVTVPVFHDDTRTDIINAVNSGKIVTIHEAPVTRGLWHGFGYIVFDPITGSGVYMIDGGSRGGQDADLLEELSGLILYILGAIGDTIAGVAATIASAILDILSILEKESIDGLAKGALIFLVVLLSIAAILALIFVGVGLALFVGAVALLVSLSLKYISWYEPEKDIYYACYNSRRRIFYTPVGLQLIGEI